MKQSKAFLSILIIFALQCLSLDAEIIRARRGKLQKRSVESDYDELSMEEDQEILKYKRESASECPSVDEKPLDMVILFDGSASITETSFAIGRTFVSALTTAIENLGKTRVGVIQFSRQPVNVLEIENMLQEAEFERKIEQTAYMNGNFTRTDLAITKAIDLLSSSPKTCRKVILTVTDGEYPSDWAKTEHAAYLASISNIELYVIGVGKTTAEQVISLLSGFDTTHQFLTDKWERLDSILNYFVDDLCAVAEPIDTPEGFVPRSTLAPA